MASCFGLGVPGQAMIRAKAKGCPGHGLQLHWRTSQASASQIASVAWPVARRNLEAGPGEQEWDGTSRAQKGGL